MYVCMYVYTHTWRPPWCYYMYVHTHAHTHTHTHTHTHLNAYKYAYRALTSKRALNFENFLYLRDFPLECALPHERLHEMDLQIVVPRGSPRVCMQN